MNNCNLCPRNCNIDRDRSVGFCNTDNKIRVARTMLHHWEEPCISGQNGSGAVFFSGCTLKCVYCQNKEISRKAVGEEYTTTELGNVFLSLQDMGAHNINLITPTHYTNKIIDALEIVKHKLKIPVIYNTSGYEKIETLKRLDGYIDVYLPDFKYYDSSISSKYSKAPDYFERAISAISEMYRQTGEYKETDNGLIEKGVIIRHLVLPSCRHDSVKVLEEIKKKLPIDNVRLSLMSQFTPDFVDDTFKELKRTITTFEYNYVLGKAIELGYKGFFQQKDSATAEYTPEF